MTFVVQLEERHDPQPRRNFGGEGCGFGFRCRPCGTTGLCFHGTETQVRSSFDATVVAGCAPVHRGMEKILRARLTGISLDGASWEYKDGDKEIIRRVFLYLEDRRVLTQHPRRSIDDLPHIIQSVMDIRRYLTTQLEIDGLSDALVYSLRSMRAASRQFLDKVGPNGASVPDESVQAQLIGILQARFGEQLSPLAEKTKLDIDPALIEIMPPDDIDWVPGFGEGGR